jgi:type I restriction enzyme R subunit
VFYRRFGKILQETIDAYRQQRINEKEYLSKVTEVMESVLGRTGDKLPEVLRDRDVAKAFYGVVNETFEGMELKEDAVPYGTQKLAADLAVQIEDEIQKRLVVDWRANPNVQNEMRNAIDDLLYEARAAKGVPLTVRDMDAIIERALDIAKNRYPR